MLLRFFRASLEDLEILWSDTRNSSINKAAGELRTVICLSLIDPSAPPVFSLGAPECQVEPNEFVWIPGTTTASDEMSLIGSNVSESPRRSAEKEAPCVLLHYLPITPFNADLSPHPSGCAVRQTSLIHLIFIRPLTWTTTEVQTTSLWLLPSHLTSMKFRRKVRTTLTKKSRKNRHQIPQSKSRVMIRTPRLNRYQQILPPVKPIHFPRW